MLYKGTMELVVENLEKLATEEVIPVFPSGASTDPLQKTQEGEVLLKALRRVWDDHTSNMVKLGQILKYMVCHFYTLSCNFMSSRIGSTRKMLKFQKLGMLG